MKGAEDSPSSSLWPLTIWTDLREPNTPELDSLIRRYQRPLMVCVLRSFPSVSREADRLVIEFIEDRILKEGWLQKADRRRGRFWDFLKISLKRYVLDQLKRRHGDETSLSDAAKSTEDADTFNLEWTRAMLSDALGRMEAYCRNPENKPQPHNSHLWEIFQVQLLEPVLLDTEPLPYGEVVKRFGLRSPSEGYNMLNTAKRIFARFLQSEIECYEGHLDAELELEELKAFLRRVTRNKSSNKQGNRQNTKRARFHGAAPMHHGEEHE